MPDLGRSHIALIFAGGAIGTLARAGLLEAWEREPGSWPWPTFIANVLGAALLAAFATRLMERPEPAVHHHALLGVGLCGALTTFSGVQLEVLEMLDAGELPLALGYVAASLAAGLLAVVLVTRGMRASAPRTGAAG
jgi:fluoride exporter